MDTEAVRRNVSEALAAVRETTATLTAGARWWEVLVLVVVVPGVFGAVEVAIGIESRLLESIERSTFHFEVGHYPVFSLEGTTAAYISVLGHYDLAHLGRNLVAYLLVVAATYPLAIIAGRRRRVLGLFVVVLLGSPIVSAALTVETYPPGTVVFGASAVVSGLVGLLVPVLFLAADRRLSRPLNPVWAGSVLCAVSAAMASGEGDRLVAVGAAALGIALLAGMAWRLGRHAVVELSKFLVEPGQYPFWVGISVAYVGTVGVVFVDAPLTNAVAHLGGYYVGFIVGLVGLSGRPRRW